MPLAPAALDLPPAAAPRPGPMPGTGSRFGLSLLLPPPTPSPLPPAAISRLLPRSSASLPSAAAGGKRRGGGCAWPGEPEGDFVGKYPMPVPGALICRSLISQLSRGRERRIRCLSARGLCVSPVLMCLWLSGEPRGGLRAESRAARFSCCHFSASPFAFRPFSGRLGTGVSVSVCLSVRPLSSWWLRNATGLGTAAGAGVGRGMGAIPQRCARARGRPPGRAAGGHRPLRQAQPARPGPCPGHCPGAAAHTSGPGPCASPGCLSLLLLSVTLGWK